MQTHQLEDPAFVESSGRDGAKQNLLREGRAITTSTIFGKLDNCVHAKFLFSPFCFVFVQMVHVYVYALHRLSSCRIRVKSEALI